MKREERKICGDRTLKKKKKKKLSCTGLFETGERIQINIHRIIHMVINKMAFIYHKWHFHDWGLYDTI